MSDEQRLQAQMIALVRAFGLHRPERTPCGVPVPVSDAHALMELAQAGATGLSPTALADRLRLDRSSVTRLVQRLAERDWLRRDSDPADGRAAILQLTDAGRATTERLAAARAAKFAGVVARLPASERAAALDALDVLVGAMEHDGARGEGDAADRFRVGASGQPAGGVR